MIILTLLFFFSDFMYIILLNVFFFFPDVLENNGGKINDFECQQRENKELSIKKKRKKTRRITITTMSKVCVY